MSTRIRRAAFGFIAAATLPLLAGCATYDWNWNTAWNGSTTTNSGQPCYHGGNDGAIVTGSSGGQSGVYSWVNCTPLGIGRQTYTIQINYVINGDPKNVWWGPTSTPGTGFQGVTWDWKQCIPNVTWVMNVVVRYWNTTVNEWLDYGSYYDNAVVRCGN